MKCSACGKEIEKSATKDFIVCKECDSEIKQKLSQKQELKNKAIIEEKGIEKSIFSNSILKKIIILSIGILIGIFLAMPKTINLKSQQNDYKNTISHLKDNLKIVEKEKEDYKIKITNLQNNVKKLENDLENFNTTEYDKKIEELNSEISSLTAQKESLNAEITKMTSAEDIILTAGNYVVGTDIKAGKYDAIAQSGRGNLFVHGTTRVNEMLGVNNEFYIPTYKNITLQDGDTIEITSSLNILFQAK